MNEPEVVEFRKTNDVAFEDDNDNFYLTDGTVWTAQTKDGKPFDFQDLEVVQDVDSSWDVRDGKVMLTWLGTTHEANARLQDEYQEWLVNKIMLS